MGLGLRRRRTSDTQAGKREKERERGKEYRERDPKERKLLVKERKTFPLSGKRERDAL